MSSILLAKSTAIELETWPASGEILDGAPNDRGLTLFERSDDGAYLIVGVFAADPAKVRYPGDHTETLFVIEGQAQIELEAGSTVELAAGDMCVLPKGPATWTFKTAFKAFFVLSD